MDHLYLHSEGSLDISIEHSHIVFNQYVLDHFRMTWLFTVNFYSRARNIRESLVVASISHREPALVVCWFTACCQQDNLYFVFFSYYSSTYTMSEEFSFRLIDRPFYQSFYSRKTKSISFLVFLLLLVMCARSRC